MSKIHQLQMVEWRAQHDLLRCTADGASPARSAQHAAARLRTRQFCDAAALALEAGLDEVARQACPLALALDWSADVDPEVVRWQAEVSIHDQPTSSKLRCI